MRCFVLLTPIFLSIAYATPVQLEFWHAMDGAQTTVQALAQDFNHSQTKYKVIPRNIGSYQKLFPKLQNALSQNRPPAFVQLEITQFATLANQKQLLNLSKYTQKLPATLMNDIHSAAWKTGQFAGQQYALPWNISVPVVIYNASVLKKYKISAPTTWNLMEQTSRNLAQSGKRPLILFSNAWLFESAVISRGGKLVNAQQPTLNSKEAITTLQQWAKMTRNQWAQLRGLDEGTQGVIDFARGHNVFILASVANWNSAKQIPFVSLGLTPLPCAKTRCSVPLGGAVLAVPKGNNAQTQAGTVAFWKYLMQPDKMAQWVKATSYAPIRKSSALLLNSWYRQNPQVRNAHNQVKTAQARPNNGKYVLWNRYLEQAISQALQGQKSAKAALDEAQQKALK